MMPSVQHNQTHHSPNRPLNVLLLLTFTALLGCDPSQQRSDFVVAHEEIIESTGQTYLSACVVAQANTADDRKSLLMQAINQLHSKHAFNHYYAELVNHQDFCSKVGRLMAIGLHSVAGDGWFEPTIYTQADQTFRWKILTSNHPNSQAEIDYTIAYMKLYTANEAAFKDKHSGLAYLEHLDRFVQSQLSKKPQFVTSGLWVDDYFISP